MMRDITWIGRWSQPCTFVSCSFYGPQYFNSVQKTMGKNFKNIIFIHRKGFVTCFMNKDEVDSFGSYMAQVTQRDLDLALLHLNSTKENYNHLKRLINDLTGRIPTKKEFTRFHNVYDRHIGYQVFIKKTIDYLAPEVFEEIFPYFKEARTYTEDVYKLTEKFFPQMLALIATKEGYGTEILSCITSEELWEYFDTGKLPLASLLEERFAGSVIISKNGVNTIVTGPQVDEIERMIYDLEGKDTVTGTTAYPGIVQGKVRIIEDPRFATIEEGEILVTTMTEPEFVMLMDKAGAIVTDIGGTLCHAAILSREMKKPCVIGTEVATRIFKTGDIVEVDAEKGIVRKI